LASCPGPGFVPPSFDCAQLGSRDNIAKPPNAIEDEIKNRLFIFFAPKMISICSVKMNYG